MMSVVEKVIDVLEDKKYLEADSKLLESNVIKRYDELMSKGIIKPRGNRLMPASKLYTQTVIFNQKDK